MIAGAAGSGRPAAAAWPGAAAALLLSLLAPAGARGGPLSPADEERTFALEAGFRIELVAAEPAVADPVSVAWDAAGRLWVSEMADYPQGPPAGRVRLLLDEDGDGRFEKSAVFAEGLPFPTSVLPFREGLLVSAAPAIWLLEDRDGDGRADLRRPVLTGFAEGNTQLRVNGLLFGIDGRIYAANGRSGGRVRRPEDPPERAVEIEARDVRFDPATFEPEAISGRSQFGHGFDDWGHRFLSWNTIHVRQDVLGPRDLERHPRLLRTETVASISDHGDMSRVYPIAPPPRTFNDEATDHFNASCGLTVERGGLFPTGYAGGVYVCEPLTGLVHRDRLEPGPGPALVARRGEEGREFLAARDPWFHPVNLRSGPDGALYLVDFYREMVEHPDYVRQELRAGVDWRRGSGHGRIWRIVPAGAARIAVEDLGKLGLPALVERLRSPVGPVRDTAERLLLERGAAGAGLEPAVAAALADLARGGGTPQAAAHALWTLERLGRLEASILAPALRSREPRVRETALRVARERPARLAGLSAEVLALAHDPDPAVRFQAALALGDLRGERFEESAVEALADIAARDGADPWFETAILSSLRDREAAFLASLLAKGAGTAASGERLLRESAVLAGAAGDAEGARRVLALALGSLDEPGARAFTLAGGLAAGLERSGKGLPERLAGEGEERASWMRILDRALLEARAASPPSMRRLRAAALLSCDRRDEAREALEALLDPGTELPLQVEAARALSRRAGGEAAVVAAAARTTPAVRGPLLDGLLARPAGREALRRGLESGELAPSELDPGRRQSLLRAFPGDGGKRLAELFGGSGDRQAVVGRYRAALEGGDAGRGRDLYRQHCAPCHRFAGLGHQVGPDLAGIARKGREELLVAVLDPNRSLAEGYAAYALITKSGEARSGVLASETDLAVTLRQQEGVEETFARSAIRSLTATGASLMPDGMESALRPSDLADVFRVLEKGELEKGEAR